MLQHQASNSKKVYLKGVTLKSTGTYRCEISAEEPDFKTVTGEQKLEVICKYGLNLIALKIPSFHLHYRLYSTLCAH